MLRKILRLFLNTLTAHEQYSLINRDNLPQSIEILLSQIQNAFSQFFSVFLKSTLNFQPFEIKDDPHNRFDFGNHGLRKRWLDKCLKNPVSEDPFTANIASGPKHSCNLDDGTFTIFIDHCECEWVGKSLFNCYTKSQDCLLTHWLPMTSIFFFIQTI